MKSCPHLWLPGLRGAAAGTVRSKLGINNKSVFARTMASAGDGHRIERDTFGTSIDQNNRHKYVEGRNTVESARL